MKGLQIIGNNKNNKRTTDELWRINIYQLAKEYKNILAVTLHVQAKKKYKKKENKKKQKKEGRNWGKEGSR